MENSPPNPQQASHPTVETDYEDGIEPFSSPDRDQRGVIAESEESMYNIPPPPMRRAFTPSEIRGRRDARDNMIFREDEQDMRRQEVTRLREEREIRRLQEEKEMLIRQEIIRLREERDRNQSPRGPRGSFQRPRTNEVDLRALRPLQEEPVHITAPQQSNTSRQWQPRPQRSLDPVIIQPNNNDRPPRPPRLPLNQYSPTSRYVQPSLIQRARFPQSQLERRFWDGYDAVPNISGQRWGELERRNFDPHNATYQYPEQSTSQHERLRNERDNRRIPHSPTFSPSPWQEPHSNVPPYYNPSFNRLIDRNGPSSYEYPMLPPPYGYSNTSAGPAPPPHPRYSHPPYAPHNFDAPFTNRYDVPVLASGQPPTQAPPSRLPPSVSRLPPENSLRQQSYYHNEPQYMPEILPPDFFYIGNPPHQPASITSRDSLSDEASYPSSSDEEEPGPGTPDNAAIDEISSDQLPGSGSTPRLILPKTDMQVDEDLLDPAGWARKSSAIETLIQNRHRNRSSWSNAWRRSDSKTCPRVMREIWSEICDVDESIAHLDIDVINLPMTGSANDLKPKGNLDELVGAFESWLLADTVKHSAPLMRLVGLPSDPERADNARHEILRLLKVRDYLILVCHDAEFLKELHPSMDAVTWFQQMPSIPTNPNKASRPLTLELKSVALAQLTGMVSCLNFILQVILWGLSEHSSMCFDKYEGSSQARKESSSIPLGFGLPYLFDPMQPKSHDPRASKRGAKVVADYMRSFDVGLAALNDEVEKLAAILSLALNLQCDVHIVAPDEPISLPLYYGITHIPEYSWIPFELGCMGELIQGRRVWGLQQDTFDDSLGDFGSIRKAHIRTKIVDLAKIWGPIWKVSEPKNNSSIWYRLPGGYLGQAKNQVSPRSDEQPCHFSTDPSEFDVRSTENSRVPTTLYLLIGHSLPSGLVKRESCRMPIERGLQGFALQSVGTLAPHKYIDSMTGQLGLSQWGLSANWSTQIKTNPGILAKESYLQRWKLEPEFRNPRMLLLWYGVELSLCTRNAKRCRIIDLLRSHMIIQYLEAIYRPQIGSDSHVPAMFAALKSSNPFDFLTLYDTYPEWRKELGMVVSRCLDLLKNTGVGKIGDLAAFAFLEKFDDSEQLAIIPKKTCTWIGLLKDTFDMATFAVVSTNCLEYLGAPGQRCRRKGQNRKSKSVLETSYIPAERLSVQKLFQTMQPSDRLKMKSSGKFKIKQRASNRAVLFGTWDALRYQLLPSTFKELYQEKRQDEEQAIKVFVVSKRTQALVHFRKRRIPTSEHGEKGGKLRRSTLSDDENNSDQSQVPTVSSTKYTFPSINTQTTTKVPSQVTLSESSQPLNEAGSARYPQQTQSSAPLIAPRPTPTANGNVVTRRARPTLIDKAVQVNIPQEQPTLHGQSSDEEDQASADPEPASTRSHGATKQKQAINDDDGPIVHQTPSNPALLSPAVDTFTNASRERERRHRRRSSTTRRRERSDAESPPRSSRQRQRSDASGHRSRSKDRRHRRSEEDTGGSMRATIAKSFGLGYNK